MRDACDACDIPRGAVIRCAGTARPSAAQKPVILRMAWLIDKVISRARERMKNLSAAMAAEWRFYRRVLIAWLWMQWMGPCHGRERVEREGAIEDIGMAENAYRHGGARGEAHGEMACAGWDEPDEYPVEGGNPKVEPDEPTQGAEEDTAKGESTTQARMGAADSRGDSESCPASDEKVFYDCDESTGDRTEDLRGDSTAGAAMPAGMAADAPSSSQEYFDCCEAVDTAGAGGLAENPQYDSADSVRRPTRQPLAVATLDSPTLSDPLQPSPAVAEAGTAPVRPLYPPLGGQTGCTGGTRHTQSSGDDDTIHRIVSLIIRHRETIRRMVGRTSGGRMLLSVSGCRVHFIGADYLALSPDGKMAVFIDLIKRHVRLITRIAECDRRTGVERDDDAVAVDWVADSVVDFELYFEQYGRQAVRASRAVITEVADGACSGETVGGPAYSGSSPGHDGSHRDWTSAVGNGAGGGCYDARMASIFKKYNVRSERRGGTERPGGERRPGQTIAWTVLRPVLTVGSLILTGLSTAGLLAFVAGQKAMVALG